MSAFSETIGEFIAFVIIFSLIVLVLFWIVLLTISLEMKDHLEKYHTSKPENTAKTVVEKPVTVTKKH